MGINCYRKKKKPYILSHTFNTKFNTIITGFSLGESMFKCLITPSNSLLRDKRNDGQVFLNTRNIRETCTLQVQHAMKMQATTTASKFFPFSSFSSFQRLYGCFAMSLIVLGVRIDHTSSRCRGGPVRGFVPRATLVHEKRQAGSSSNRTLPPRFRPPYDCRLFLTLLPNIPDARARGGRGSREAPAAFIASIKHVHELQLGRALSAGRELCMAHACMLCVRSVCP